MLSQGIREVAMNHLTEILLLAYADDLVILANTPMEMKKTLRIL